ncbi:MAG: hypothetical protein ABI743_01600 [bacterium]
MTTFALPLTLPSADTGPDNAFVRGLLAIGHYLRRGLPDATTLDAAVGGCYTFAVSPEACAHWWIGAGNARDLATLGAVTGWELEHHAGDGTEEGYHDYLRAAVVEELTYGRPVLAYGGWPGIGKYHWGVITAIGHDAHPVGNAPGAETRPVQMDGWPYHVVQAKPRGRDTIWTSDLVSRMMSKIPGICGDVVGVETKGLWHTGASAWDFFRAAVERPGAFCEHCTDQSCLAALVTHLQRDHAALAWFLHYAWDAACVEDNALVAPLSDAAAIADPLSAQWAAFDATTALSQRPALAALIAETRERWTGLVACLYLAAPVGTT